MANVIKKRKRIKFRASGVHDLLAGGNELTEKQLATLSELEMRKAGTFLTATGKVGGFSVKNKTDLEELISKRDAPFEFGETAKAFIEEKWLFDKYGARKVVETKEMIKGKECEQDSMGLAQRVLGGKELRVSRKTHLGSSSKYFTGTPDIDLKIEETVEDIKTPWDIFQFMKKVAPDTSDPYYTQLQVYMDLLGYEKSRLIYCLVDTPLHLIQKEGRKFLYMYGGEIDNPDYLDAMDQLYTNHIFDDIEDELKVKAYDVERDDKHLNNLKEMVDYAQDYYYSLSLNMLKK